MFDIAINYAFNIGCQFLVASNCLMQNMQNFDF